VNEEHVIGLKWVRIIKIVVMMSDIIQVKQTFLLLTIDVDSHVYRRRENVLPLNIRPLERFKVVDV